jgi:hypothetical protein
VKDAGYFNCFFCHQINRDIRQGREYDLALSQQAAARSPYTRKLFQPVATLIDRSGYAGGCFGVIDLDPLADAL